MIRNLQHLLQLVVQDVYKRQVESYVKRLENLEEISSSFEGVEQAFAVQAGREVRIMVKPEDVYKRQAECRAAGIRPVMITGDHKDTAVAIARELGIIQDASEAITGAEQMCIRDRVYTPNSRTVRQTRSRASRSASASWAAGSPTSST